MRLPLAAYDTGAGALGMKTNKQTNKQELGIEIGKDPFFFQIILGGKIKAQVAKIKELDDALGKHEEENHQGRKDIRDLKNEVKHKMDVLDEIEIDLDKKDNEIQQLKEQAGAELCQAQDKFS